MVTTDGKSRLSNPYSPYYEYLYPSGSSIPILIGSWSILNAALKSESLTGYRFVPRQSGLTAFGMEPLPVNHVWREVSPLSSGSASYVDSNGNRFLWSSAYLAALHRGNFNSSLPSFYSSAEGHMSLDSDMSNLSDEVLEDAAGNLPPKASLLVDLAEIGQVISMVTDARTMIRELPRKFRHIERTRGCDFLGILRDLTTADLIYKFGVAPLIGTLVALYNWQREVQERLTFLALSNNDAKPRRVRRVRRYSGTVTKSAITDSWYEKDCNYFATVSASCRCLAQYKTSASAAGELFRQYFALASFSNALWNIIPYSFVADWFINVGRLAERIDRDLPFDTSMTDWVQVHNGMRAKKVEFFSRLSYDGVLQSPYSARLRASCLVRYGSFTRLRGFSNDLPSSLAASGWDSWRLGTAGELVLQKILTR